jgi:predicted ATP-grasp superfamily ATP-dependent carboligase
MLKYYDALTFLCIVTKIRIMRRLYADIFMKIMHWERNNLYLKCALHFQLLFKHKEIISLFLGI